MTLSSSLFLTPEVYSMPDEAAAAIHASDIGDKVHEVKTFTKTTTSLSDKQQQVTTVPSEQPQAPTILDNTSAAPTPAGTSTTISAAPKFNRKKNAEILAAQYTSTKRSIEKCSISLYTFFFVVAIYRSVTAFSINNAWVVLSAGVLGMIVADFFSGIMHWLADTWGDLNTPIFGQSLIRSFREHHVVPTAICKHDWIEANGDNCAITLPFVILAAFHSFDHSNSYALFVHNFLLITSFWAAITNQIHKWSHTYKPPKVVTLLQDYGMIISKQDHAIHHRNPFDKYYCITNGWCNGLLASIGFWKTLETIVSNVTGCIPREDDHLWTGITAKLE